MKIQFQTHLDFARKNPGWPLFVLDGLWGVSDALIIISLYFLLELKRHLNWSDFSVCPAPSAGCATGPSRAACTLVSISCSQSVSRSIACQPCLQPSLCPPHQKRPPWKQFSFTSASFSFYIYITNYLKLYFSRILKRHQFPSLFQKT